jgi:hypothetical protein
MANIYSVLILINRKFRISVKLYLCFSYIQFLVQPEVAVSMFILSVKWSEVKWGEVKWGEVKWSEVKWSEVKWSEVKWSEVKWSGVKWSEVKSTQASVTNADFTEAQKKNKVQLRSIDLRRDAVQVTDTSKIPSFRGHIFNSVAGSICSNSKMTFQDGTVARQRLYLRMLWRSVEEFDWVMLTVDTNICSQKCHKLYIYIYIYTCFMYLFIYCYRQYLEKFIYKT